MGFGEDNSTNTKRGERGKMIKKNILPKGNRALKESRLRPCRSYTIKKKNSWPGEVAQKQRKKAS